ncbi:DUF4214 domain-containing protein [Salinibacterium sp. ZJ450]|uniref:DUF4214 domain-containing protein n=1 Tax=Salinibacterium sp. ZJ450 TaxID=2708338 RepID=UPI001423932A|nr:DUF4214 domain-containing protein [Salinibacterium sp. ZJ450]
MNTPTREHRSPVLRRVAVIAGLAMAITGIQAVSANALPTDPETTISITFDDSNADQQAAVNILDSHGMKGTFYTVSGFVDAPNYLTRAQLTAMQANGHEIGGHTVTHADLTTSSATEARRQVCNDRATLLDWGFQVRSFAYPFASVNDAARAIVSDCGYNNARGLGDVETRFGCAGCGFAEEIPPGDPFVLKAPDQQDSTWTLQDLQTTVINAEERRTTATGWIVLTFHHLCDNACDALAISSTVFGQFTDWLAERATTENTHVRTVGEVVGGAVKPAVSVAGITPPAPGPGVNGLLNPSLETAGAGGAPQCWQSYGFGTNTPAFAAVNPGRTGNVAERMTMSAYTDGDARLMPVLDLGECAPTVTPGKTYSLRAWYTSTAPTQFAVYLRSGIGTWQYWTSSPLLVAATAYTQAEWTSPAIPAGSTGISFGMNLISTGTLTTDDYALYDTVGAPPVTGTPPPPATGAGPFVQKLYRDFLGRAATAAEVDRWSIVLAAGPQTHYSVSTELSRSDEWISTVVTKFYRDTLGREPDPAGLAGWVQAAKAGMPVAQIAAGFYASPEYFGTVGQNNFGTWVSDLYQKLLLRAPDAAGLQGWVTALQAGMGRDQLAFGFYQAPETLGVRITALYQTLLSRPPEAGAIPNWSPFVRDFGDLVLAAALAGSAEYNNLAQATP